MVFSLVMGLIGLSLLIITPGMWEASLLYGIVVGLTGVIVVALAIMNAVSKDRI